MQVGVVAMAMQQRRVQVRMRVRFAAVPREIMLVLMMGVVTVRMCMRQGLMAMFVFVLLEQMQTDTGGHQ